MDLYVGTVFGRAIEASRRLKSKRYALVRIGWRLFTVQMPRLAVRRRRSYYTDLKPLPRHRGSQMVTDTSNETHPIWAETYIRFWIDGNRGRFKQIEVVQERARKGWATDMVRALLKVYPDAVWQNENLNENSGPLFQTLSARFPERIAKVSPDLDGVFSVGPALTAKAEVHRFHQRRTGRTER